MAAAAPAPVAPVPSSDAAAAPALDGPVCVPLGKLAVEHGLVTQLQLAGAFAEQFTSGKRLGEILQERGLLTAADVARLLALQKGLRFVDHDVAADFSALSHEESNRLSAVVVTLGSGDRAVAVSDPADGVLDHVRHAAGQDLDLVVVPEMRLAALLGRQVPEQASRTPAAEDGAGRPAPGRTLDPGQTPNGNAAATADVDQDVLAAGGSDGGEGRAHPGAETLAAVEKTLAQERQAERDLERKLDARTAETVTAKHDVDAARRAAADLERGLSETTAELVATRRELDAAVAARAEVDGSASETEAELERRFADVTAELERRLTTATDELATTAHELNSARAANTTLERTFVETIGALEHQVNELSAGLAATWRELETAHAATAESNRRLEQATAELERRVLDTTADLTATRRELDAARDANEAHVASLRSAAAQREARDGQLIQMLESVTAVLRESLPHS